MAVLVRAVLCTVYLISVLLHTTEAPSPLLFSPTPAVTELGMSISSLSPSPTPAVTEQTDSSSPQLPFLPTSAVMQQGLSSSPLPLFSTPAITEQRENSSPLPLIATPVEGLSSSPPSLSTLAVTLSSSPLFSLPTPSITEQRQNSSPLPLLSMPAEGLSNSPLPRLSTPAITQQRLSSSPLPPLTTPAVTEPRESSIPLPLLSSPSEGLSSSFLPSSAVFQQGIRSSPLPSLSTPAITEQRENSSPLPLLSTPAGGLKSSLLPPLSSSALFQQGISSSPLPSLPTPAITEQRENSSPLPLLSMPAEGLSSSLRSFLSTLAVSQKELSSSILPPLTTPAVTEQRGNSSPLLSLATLSSSPLFSLSTLAVTQQVLSSTPLSLLSMPTERLSSSPLPPLSTSVNQQGISSTPLPSLPTPAVREQRESSSPLPPLATPADGLSSFLLPPLTTPAITELRESSIPLALLSTPAERLSSSPLPPLSSSVVFQQGISSTPVPSLTTPAATEQRESSSPLPLLSMPAQSSFLSPLSTPINQQGISSTPLPSLPTPAVSEQRESSSPLPLLSMPAQSSFLSPLSTPINQQEISSTPLPSLPTPAVSEQRESSSPLPLFSTPAVRLSSSPQPPLSTPAITEQEISSSPLPLISTSVVTEQGGSSSMFRNFLRQSSLSLTQTSEFIARTDDTLGETTFPVLNPTSHAQSTPESRVSMSSTIPPPGTNVPTDVEFPVIAAAGGGVGAGVAFIIIMLVLTVVVIFIMRTKRRRKTLSVGQDEQVMNNPVYSVNGCQTSSSMEILIHEPEYEAPATSRRNSVIYHTIPDHDPEVYEMPAASPQPNIYHIPQPANAGITSSMQHSEMSFYVPTEEQRRTLTRTGLTGIKGIYASLSDLEIQRSSGRFSSFFEDSETYWRPASDVSQLYRQLSNRRYREIPRDQIQITEKIGSGQFGTVNKGIWQSPAGAMEVAVKTLHSSASEEDRVKFLQEAAIMGQFKHPNVVMLKGVATVGEPVMIILELLTNGDLRNYLIKQRPAPGELLPSDQPQVLLEFCQQIAAGMDYLASKAFVHRDLAARNVLVSAGKTCKITDFGMARDLMSENYNITRGGMIPVKWTAPEALHFKKYSTASDVWSYGAVMYEVWSLGHKPFQGHNNIKVVKMVDSGYRVPPPPGCPRDIYQLMIQCWHPQASSRPTFSQLLQALCQPEAELLGWSGEDTSVHPQAPVLGAPLEAGKDLYPELQEIYIYVPS